MSSVLDQLLEWSATRALWQQDALRRLAVDGAVSDEQIGKYAAACAAEPLSQLEPLAEEHLAASGSSVTEPVVLVGIRDAENVNSLAPGQALTFSPVGLNVVYGDNGTGKSGYARILKAVTRTRAPERVLSDIFRNGGAMPSAVVEYKVGGQASQFAWAAGEQGPAALSRVSFFDAACSEIYLAKETGVAFRPFGLGLFDELVGICERVRTQLDNRAMEASRRTAGLPPLTESTEAGRFLVGMTAQTSRDAVLKATEFTPEQEGRMAVLTQSLDQQKRGTAAGDAKRLERLAERGERLVGVLDHVASQVSPAGRESLVRLRDDNSVKEQAARAARTQALGRAILPGVGEAAWRTLWEAARAYSQKDAYPDQAFPATDNAACVLCQRPLDPDAADRLSGFEEFVKDTTEQAAQASEQAYLDALQKLERLVVRDQSTADLIEDWRAEDEATAGAVDGFLAAASTALAELIKLAQAGHPEQATSFPASPHDVLKESIDALRDKAVQLHSVMDQQGLEAAAAELDELKARQSLARARDAVIAEHDRLQLQARLAGAKQAAATHSITQKGAELTNAALTEVLMDRFSRESDRLGLEKVVLRTVGGRRGVLMYRRGFVGAVHDAPLPAVLSEGEQTALGMAGFLAEVWTDETRSAVVFDDPVSSLDHERRDKVAERLVGLAQDRQTVVFTHDVAFVLALKKHAVAKSVPVTERSVEKWAGSPGHCQDYHKFSAKLVKERLQELDETLGRIRSGYSTTSSSDYRDETARWYRLLRKTWERAIEEALVGDILTRDDLQVHPAMVRTLVLFTADDNRKLQSGYGRATELSEVHDESPVINAPAPSLDDMQTDLAQLRDWHKAIVARRNFSEDKIYELSAADERRGAE